jgi:nicotinate-nucleotide pyrophosphorylase (carboxylating)
VTLRPLIEEGTLVRPGRVLAEIDGPVRSILTAERTALNFLGRMSGIATLTHQFVDTVAGTTARILDTRKTAPGIRLFDKIAVVRGGGTNHRHGLDDVVLIKDNHIDFAGSLEEAVKRVRQVVRDAEIEVEARSLEDVRAALGAGVRRIMLDNMDLETMRQAVALARGHARLEASGGVDLTNVRQVAETGVDDISIGALTHSAKAFDVSLELAGRRSPQPAPADAHSLGGGEK